MSILGQVLFSNISNFYNKDIFSLYHKILLSVKTPQYLKVYENLYPLRCKQCHCKSWMRNYTTNWSSAAQLEISSSKRNRLLEQRLRGKEKVLTSKSRRKKEYANYLLYKSQEDKENAKYYIENGLRKVYPYMHEYKRDAKARWLNTKIGDLMKKEFGFYGLAVLRTENMFTDGQLTVNNERVSPEYVIQQNDTICNVVHRHENPILAASVQILSDSKTYLVVNKPPSWPCHPCGGYRHNSLSHVLQFQYGYDNLSVCHRLDRLTSGVLFLSKTSEESRKFSNLLQEFKLQKEYVCRVQGEFPEEEVTVDQPISRVGHRIGLMVVGGSGHGEKEGKEAVTRFMRLSYNGRTSVVKCYPVTGRTHQIRVHLQYLGFPIFNDPLYNHSAWGPHRGKSGQYPSNLQEVCDRISETHIYPCTQGNALYEEKFGPQVTSTSNDKHTHLFTEQHHNKNDGFETPPARTFKEKRETNSRHLNPDSNSTSDISEQGIKCVHKESLFAIWDSLGPLDQSLMPFDKSKFIIKENCPVCRSSIAEPSKKQLIMFLHALSLKGPDWHFRTPLPSWAHSDWNHEDLFKL